MAISFKTARLDITELTDNLSPTERIALLKQIPAILSPRVVEQLPSYFHGIVCEKTAEIWLIRMQSESRLLQVADNNARILGFMFIYPENEFTAHIGYLLAEEYWGKGLASELLQGFIGHIRANGPWQKLIGGVAQSNIASCALLTKAGFVALAPENGVIFYEYTIPKS
ncbi:MAG: GNAT family N-acetyltransferase [Oceanospirillaceae bacterium]|nr:GNAT family N-acetyltransferase [Oceanospirillaceae bacterium]MCP5334470.1 GNAT family N-acetyltransferase [Oceanospirillaceae bacterium]MCP5350822.1 GNAT family N-acetyltransferase [Oceanospirillaceae bacterium]